MKLLPEIFKIGCGGCTASGFWLYWSSGWFWMQSPWPENTVWLHTGTEADSIRVRHLSARRDSVGVRLPSARFGVENPDRHPCRSMGQKRCTWIMPWIRASRSRDYAERRTPNSKPSSANDTSTDDGWLTLPTRPPYLHVR